MQFSLTAITVAVLFLYALPGFILVKLKAIKPESISAFSKVLVYACQPCLTLYSFQSVTYTKDLLATMGIVLGLSAGLMLFVIGVLFLIYRKKYDDPGYRVATLAPVLGNVGFLGVPIVTALLPNFTEAICYSAVFIVGMNIICWTIGCFIYTGDKKYFSVKKLFLNPPMLTLIIALPLFFTCTALPSALLSPVTLMARMTTPLCMIIVGMRFATVDYKRMLMNKKLYISAAVKLVIFPLLAYVVTLGIPIDQNIKTTLFILCCMPTASLVLNFAELFGKGQEDAANSVLLTTALSMITIPVLLLLC